MVDDMGQALYRKYRSKSLSEIVGQEHITDTLSKALASGRISHAYLFSGPRGTGKTSIARILAHEINGLPYTDDAAHLDIIEIDAASNRRIDEIRDLRDKVYIAPTSGKYKVYIIDEVHMLTREAFNALLKTLEEPPAHVVFILATTEAHKLPETIISRTQHYTFKPVEQQKVIDHLRHIAKGEKVDIDDAALGLLAAHGEGSFRDSISLLDQARSIVDSKIGIDDIRLLLGIAPEEAIDGLIAGVGQAGQASALLKQVGELYGQGLQAASIASQLSTKLRTSLVKGKPLLPVPQALALMKNLIEVPASHNPERLLEIVLLESADTSDMVATAPAPVQPVAEAPASPEPEPAPKATKAKPSATKTEKPPEEPKKPAESAQPEKSASKPHKADAKPAEAAPNPKPAATKATDTTARCHHPRRRCLATGIGRHQKRI